MNITKILRDRRIELGISQALLAEHCGFANKSSVFYIENGRTDWTLKNLIRACELLKIEMVIREKQDD